MAFSLEQAVRQRNETDLFLYLVCDQNHLRQQYIYRVFDNISTGFMNCVERDLENFKNISQPVNWHAFPSFFKSHGLYTYGFVHALLTQKMGQQHVDVSPCTYETIRSLMGEKKVIIFLDEFLTGHDDDSSMEYNKARFIRNMFRFIHAAVIVSGTNTHAANLPDPNRMSRGKCVYWCYLTDYVPSTLVTQVGLPQVLLYILKNSRPWFAQLVGSHWNSTTHTSVLEFLNEFIPHVSNIKK